MRINKILKDIDNEECYYVGTNGCLYQDLDKEELLAIKHEIERLNKALNECEARIETKINRYMNESEYIVNVDDLIEILDHLKELRGSDKE